jgi:hypothetical protein
MNATQETKEFNLLSSEVILRNAMKLYEVKIERSIMVMAESETKAAELGWYHEKDELDNDGVLGAWQIENIQEVPPEWRDSIPYGGVDDKTCAQILEKNEKTV